MTCGERISELRLKNGLTQDELAKKIGITRAALSHYEKDRREPDFDTLQKLSDFFEVSTDYLLTGRTDRTGPIIEQPKSTEIFSTRLRQLREKKHLSISDISERIKRTESYIEKLESSPSQLPGQDVLNSLSEVFGVTRDYLCGYTDDPQGYGTSLYDNDPKDLVEMIRTQGPVMFDGETIETDEDKAKMIELMRLAHAMVKQQNKDIAAKRRKKGSKGESDKD